jgi:hypothetical protein
MKKMRTIGLTLLAALVIAAMAVGVAVAAGSGAAKKKSQPAGVAKAVAGEAAGLDGDNVLSGDQSAPDAADSSSESSASESSSDSTEAGQPGEPAQGHADPAGDVNHDCTGSCQE